MDLLNRLLPNRGRPTTQSSSGSSAPTSARSEDECSVCASPCSVHPSYPSHLSIDDGDMRGSVKRHRRHILVSQGRPYSRWPQEVTDQPDAYITVLSRLIRERERLIGYKVRVSETDYEEEAAAAAAEDEQRDDDRADLFVFPDMLHFPAVSRQSLPLWVDGLLVDDRGAMHFKQQHAEAADRVRQAEQAAAVSSTEQQAGELTEGSAASLPDVDFECRPVIGCAVLICAHKQRDKRCGVTGPILARQIEQECSERREAEEREAAISEQQRIRDGLPQLTSAPVSSLRLVRTMFISHIGGHKYAGNVIVYPAGVWYGRVTPCHVHLLLDAYATQAHTDEAAGSGQQRTAASRRKLDELRRGEVELEW